MCEIVNPLASESDFPTASCVETRERIHGADARAAWGAGRVHGWVLRPAPPPARARRRGRARRERSLSAWRSATYSRDVQAAHLRGGRVVGGDALRSGADTAVGVEELSMTQQAMRSLLGPQMIICEKRPACGWSTGAKDGDSSHARAL